jgi:hypothetical protein
MTREPKFRLQFVKAGDIWPGDIIVMVERGQKLVSMMRSKVLKVETDENHVKFDVMDRAQPAAFHVNHIVTAYVRINR